MERAQARSDLDLIADVVQRTSQRIDAHAFHCVHWGWIVLVWYPLANWFAQREMMAAYAATIVASVLLGTALSVWRGAAASRHPRLLGGNTFVSGQLLRIVAGNVAAGFVLSFAAPATGFIDGPDVPVIWGLVYANMTFMMGVAYSRDFTVSSLAIFAGCVLALLWPQYNGYILGPCMGLGMILPGMRAEARVRALLRDGAGAAA
jgi:hypothetical protein